MAKLQRLIKDLAKRAGFESEELTEFLGNEALDVEVSEEVEKGLLKGLYSLDMAKEQVETEISNRTKAEVLNGIDASIESIFSEMLGDKFESVNEESSTHKKLAKISNLLTQTKAPKEDTEKVKNLEKALDEANAKLRVANDEFETKLSEATNAFKKDLFLNNLKTRVLSRSDIAKDKMENRHFLNNFLSDYEEYLGEHNLKVDFENGNVLKGDGTPYYDDRNEKVALDDILSTVVEHYEYKKVSDKPDEFTYKPSVDAKPRSANPNDIMEQMERAAARVR